MINKKAVIVTHVVACIAWCFYSHHFLAPDNLSIRQHLSIGAMEAILIALFSFALYISIPRTHEQ